jgi:hypothetical protein
MHDSYLLRLFVFNQPKKCFEKGKKNIGFNHEKTFSDCDSRHVVEWK